MAGKAGHRGFGHIRKLPSGRFQASYLGPDLARHTAPTTFQARIDAEAWIAAERRHVESDDWRPPKQRATLQRRDTFAAYADAWLTRRRVRNEPLRPRTRTHYRKLLDDHIVPTFGDMAVRHITTEAVASWYASLPAGTPTQNAHAYALLKTILGTAVDEDIVTANPCRIRGASQTRRAGRTEPATLDELATIVENVPPRFRLMMMLAAWCALRFGELAELRRSDLNRERNIIRVRRAVSWADGEMIVGRPKTDAGNREVAIPPHLVPFVKAHLADMPVAGRDALLFPGASDPTKPMRQSTLQRAYYPAREAAGRSDLRFHDLRHTGAVLAASTGATLAELMARLGHSSPAAAMRYQHAAQGRDVEIARLLSDLARVEPSV